MSCRCRRWRPNEKSEIASAIAAFRLSPVLVHSGTIDSYGEAVLKRLEDRDDIAEAFVRITAPPRLAPNGHY